MSADNTIQKQMYIDVKDKSIFDKAQNFGHQYLENVLTEMYTPRKVHYPI